MLVEVQQARPWLWPQPTLMVLTGCMISRVAGGGAAGSSSGPMGCSSSLRNPTHSWHLPVKVDGHDSSNWTPLCAKDLWHLAGLAVDEERDHHVLSAGLWLLACAGPESTLVVEEDLQAL